RGASGIDFHADSAGGRDENFALAFFTQSNARLFRDHSGHARVVAYGGGDDLIRFGCVENYDCAGGKFLRRWHPFRHVLKLGVDISINSNVSGEFAVPDNM